MAKDGRIRFPYRILHRKSVCVLGWFRVEEIIKFLRTSFIIDTFRRCRQAYSVLNVDWQFLDWASCSQVMCLVSNKDKVLNPRRTLYEVLNIFANEGCISRNDDNVLSLVQQTLRSISRQQILPVFFCVGRNDILEIEVLYFIFPLQR